MRLILALLCAVSLCACATARQPEAACIVNSQGAVSPTTRSALAGSTAPGRQEIIGIYIPFVGTGLAVKAGLEWDGTPTVIEVPVAPPLAAQVCEESTETYYVPETRMVPKTRTVRRAVVPVPQAAPNPCAPPAPAPQAAPRACPEPSACVGPECEAPATPSVASR